MFVPAGVAVSERDPPLTPPACLPPPLMAKAMATPGSVKDELLVFGYACKVFRDDERARSLDRGVHLIPWMGDESIRMDRSVNNPPSPPLSFPAPE